MNKFFLTILLSPLCMLSGHNQPDSGTIPGQVDNSNTKYFPTIENQGQIGACDWFAAVYYQMTYMFNKQYDRAAAVENTFSPKFGYNILNNAGIYPYNIRLDDVYKFVQKHGSATMADCPYDMANGTGYTKWCTDPAVWRNALAYRIEGYRFFTCKNAAPNTDYSFEDFNAYFSEIKRLLGNGEVLVIQSNTNPEKCSYSKVGNDPSTTEDDPYTGEFILYNGDDGPDHTMAMVGYNDHIWVDLNHDGKPQDQEKGAFKIADSFGLNNIPDRNRGFFWMAYSTVDSSIFQHRVNRMIIRKDYKSRILCTITLNSAERDKVRFQFGWSADDIPEHIPVDNARVFDPYGMGYAVGTSGVSLIEGGNFSFDGGSDPCDGSFVFDLMDIYKKDDAGYYYLKIENKCDKPIFIKAFEIFDAETGITLADKGLPCMVLNDEIYRFVKIGL